ncbi:ribosome maturation factor RimP [Tessaracoccus sp. OH4464_COT-324]|uniref:ribosome maturation factor RimP n=1 Tax=Tessaracoccus sp. OH4464_COT-324 TaxID=2491059 RepID=UPI000F62ECB6|nr:ribosome maturation factor RimP [Tessaracoccus sp. OH4464_COT-324]RRD47750.1 ribosome maturation factor RimP [Tessaracoccus sp. OH4464_COT-324]
MQERAIAEVVEPILASFGLELDDLDVTPVGKRALLRVTVDGDGPEGKGPLLDDIAEASQAISVALDESPAVGELPYTLELSSRGVSKPLTELKHYRRNIGRLVKLWLAEGEKIARIVAVTDDAVVVEPETAYPLDQINKAIIQVELNRKEA